MYYKTLGGMGFNAQQHYYSYQKGFPDVFVFVNGIVYTFELKREKGKLTPNQKLTFEELRKRNFKIKILRPSEWIEAKKNIRTKEELEKWIELSLELK